MKRIYNFFVCTALHIKAHDRAQEIGICNAREGRLIVVWPNYPRSCMLKRLFDISSLAEITFHQED